MISDFEEMKALIAKLAAGQALDGLSVEDDEDDEETFNANVAHSEEGLPPVIMFAFDDYFPAVAATDLLVCVVSFRFAHLFFSSFCFLLFFPPKMFWSQVLVYFGVWALFFCSGSSFLVFQFELLRFTFRIVWFWVRLLCRFALCSVSVPFFVPYPVYTGNPSDENLPIQTRSACCFFVF